MRDAGLRTAYAEAAHDLYQRVSGGGGASRSDIIDLITDLLLYADANGLGARSIAEIADEHFRAEISLTTTLARGRSERCGVVGH